VFTLVSSAARVASGNSGDLNQSNTTGFKPERTLGAILVLTVSVAATDAGDTLDVYVQNSIDAGATYDDFIHFTQVLGNGGAKTFVAKWHRDLTPERELGAIQDAAMAAGVNQGVVGPNWRVKWVIVDAGTVNVSFTFKVEMLPIYR
jgi:hypothetical protein